MITKSSKNGSTIINNIKIKKRKKKKKKVVPWNNFRLVWNFGVLNCNNQVRGGTGEKEFNFGLKLPYFPFKNKYSVLVNLEL